MKHISPSLIAIAAFVVAPAAYGLDVKDDDVKLGLSLQIQVRGEVAHAVANNGQSWNVAENTSGNRDPVDFYIRRMRLGFKGSWKGDYKFAAILRADNQDKAKAGGPSDGSSTAAPTTANRTPQMHVAYIERVIKQDDLGIEHSIKVGLDYAFFNGASGVFSSSQFLFPMARATDQSGMLAPRGTGIAYKISTPVVTWGVDVQNNTGDDDSVNSKSGDGLCYTTRAHISPTGDWHIVKPQESYVGQDGKGVLLSLEYGKNTNLRTTAQPRSVDLAAYGSELLVHVDGLTALGEYRIARQSMTPSNATSEVSKRIWLVQAGYALPMGDTFIEPAIRYSKIDLDRDNYTANADGIKNYGNGEYGGSGKQIEAGINWYLHGHNNKVQFAYQNWKAEAAKPGLNNTTAQANVYRAQWQLSF